MTPQEIYDTVSKHLLKQNTQSRISDNTEGMCAYKSDDGLKCAAGCLIPDELYDPRIETHGIEYVFAHWPEVAAHIGPENLKLVERLQEMHDNLDPEDWPVELNYVATVYGLTP